MRDKPIKTYLKRLLSAIRQPAERIIPKNDQVVFFATITLALVLLLIKGVNFDSRDSLLANFLTKYVEETAAASVVEPSQNDFADINSLSIQANDVLGKNTLDFQTLQDNSLFSYSSVLENIASEFSGFGNEIANYTVQDGDTISFIASDFGVSINTIIWANNLKSADDIKPGIELKIPPVTGVIHKVKAEDTLANIAQKYSADKDRIISFNNLPASGELPVDVEIIIPDGKIRVALASPKSDSSYAFLKRFANLPILDGFFGVPTIVRTNLGRIHGRNGVDLDNACGTAIFAAADGNITIAKASGYNGGFGRYIKIVHPNGTETLYAHMSSLLAGVGQFVAQGTQIGIMGTTGRSTGCHLHFEVHGAKNPYAKR